jgi:hypothetical protein
MRHEIGRGVAFGLLAVGLVGCGGGPQFAEVEGTVTRDGKPLERVQVEFHPDGVGPRSQAVTDAAGKYVLKSDDGSRAGAVVGSHKVVLRDMSMYPDRPLSRDELNQDFSKGKTIRIKPEYGDPAKTPVTKSVSAGNKNVIDIEVK